MTSSPSARSVGITPAGFAPTGFTLVELMITIAVLGILLAIGIPSFQSAMNSSRLTGVSNELLSDLMTARTQATSKGIRLVVCNSNNQTACTDTSWKDGWILFEDNNRDSLVSPGEVILRVRQALPGNFVVTSAGNRVVFLPSGAIGGVSDTVSFCLPTTQPPQNVRNVVIAAPSGRLRVQALPSATPGVCP